MRPNIILLGLMHSWKTRSEDDIESYYNIVHDALTLNFGVGILRVPLGLDVNQTTENGDVVHQSDREPIQPSPKKSKTANYLSCCTGTDEEAMELNQPGLDSIFQGEPVERKIDVYWLFDDGGLTLLLPHLLSLRQFWSKGVYICKHRVFCLKLVFSSNPRFYCWERGPFG